MLALDKKFVLLFVLLPFSLALFVWLYRENLPIAVTQYGILMLGLLVYFRFRTVLPLIAVVTLFLHSIVPDILRGELNEIKVAASLGFAIVVGLTLWLYKVKGYIALAIPLGILFVAIAIFAFFVLQGIK